MLSSMSVKYAVLRWVPNSCCHLVKRFSFPHLHFFHRHHSSPINWLHHHLSTPQQLLFRSPTPPTPPVTMRLLLGVASLPHPTTPHTALSTIQHSVGMEWVHSSMKWRRWTRTSLCDTMELNASAHHPSSSELWHRRSLLTLRWHTLNGNLGISTHHHHIQAQVCPTPCYNQS